MISKHNQLMNLCRFQSFARRISERLHIAVASRTGATKPNDLNIDTNYCHGLHSHQNQTVSDEEKGTPSQGKTIIHCQESFDIERRIVLSGCIESVYFVRSQRVVSLMHPIVESASVSYASRYPCT